MMRLSTLLIALACTASYSACANTNITDKEGADYFNLKAELPKETSFTNAEAKYISLTPENCPKENLSIDSYGVSVQGSKTVSLMDEQSEDHGEINQRIPLSYQRGICNMWLYSIDLVAASTYGPEYWQDATTAIMIDVLKQHPQSAPDFDATGTLAINQSCSWLFRVDGKNISKLLFCSVVDQDGRARTPLHNWKAIQSATHITTGINKLAGKTIKLNLHIADEEHPTFEDSWIKTVNGWQLCETEEDSPFCKAPVSVSKFKMNGRECTVYPNCTE
jgi:hypothetical protein